MQFKSLSYGHFPLNLLGMSAPQAAGSCLTALGQFLPERGGRRRNRVEPCLS